MYNKCSLATGLFFLFGWMVLFGGCSTKNKPIRPMRRDITQAIYASGKVYPAKYYKVSANLPGYLDKVLVRVGDTVSVGQPLFTVRNDMSNFGVATSKNALDLATRNNASSSPLLAAAMEEVALARAKHALDSNNYARYAALQTAGAGTRQALDQARTQFETSRLNIRRAQANLDATRLRLRAEYDNAKTAFGAQQSNQNNYTVASTIHGMVYDQIPRIGEFVGPQTVVVELGETNDFEVELSIDETDINFIRKGLEVFYGSDALGGKLGRGRVLEVYPKITQNNKSIKAIASLELPAGQVVFAGSTLEANIIFSTKKNALVLPRAYVMGDSVTLRKRGKYTAHRIKKGIIDINFVEILEGLDEKNEVYRL